MVNEGICRQQKAMSILKIISLCVKSIFSEVHWNVIKGLRKWEIKDLKKRLDSEYAKLGKLYYGLKEDDEKSLKEIEFVKNQIDYLETEIDALEKDIENLRHKMVKERSKHL